MSREVISELIAAGDFLAINGTDGMCRRWERAKADYAATLHQQAESNGDFKNFHRLLCERFGYTHDEKDWKRDQLSLIEWIARQQAGRVDDEEFDLRKYVRHMADVLEAGVGLIQVDSDLARLGAAIQAALAQNTQGDGEAVAWMCETVNGYVAFSRDGNFPCNVGKVSPLYLHAERARVPEGWSIKKFPLGIVLYGPPATFGSMQFTKDSTLYAFFDALLAAAPSQRAEVK